MRIDIALSEGSPLFDLRVGNVYAVRGGRGASVGNMMVVVAITDTHDRGTPTGANAVYLTISREGEVISGGHYSPHYLEDKPPIAYVEGIEDLTLAMRSL